MNTLCAEMIEDALWKMRGASPSPDLNLSSPKRESWCIMRTDVIELVDELPKIREKD